MGRLGMWEIIIIVSVIVLLFGAKKIPEIASSVGKAMREFKKATRDDEPKKNIEDKADGPKQ